MELDTLSSADAGRLLVTHIPKAGCSTSGGQNLNKFDRPSLSGRAGNANLSYFARLGAEFVQIWTPKLAQVCLAVPGVPICRIW